MSISDKITAQAPATCANLGSGFDVLGIALHAPFDRVAVCRNSHQRIRLTRVEGDNGKLPAKGLANVAVFVCAEFLRRIGSRQGVDIELEKGVPISSGLGSSAASSVATLKALNQLFESPLTDLELLQLAMQGEAHLSGALHADNVAPSLLGGLVLVAENDPLCLLPCPFPSEFEIVVAHPDFELPTARSRAVLPHQVPLKIAVRQWGHLAALIAALHQEKYGDLKRWMVDLIVEPARESLIPGFCSVQTAARDAGAICCTISGGGPSVFSLADCAETGSRVGKAMQQAFRSHGLQCQIYRSTVNPAGTILL